MILSRSYSMLATLASYQYAAVVHGMARSDVIPVFYVKSLETNVREKYGTNPGPGSFKTGHIESLYINCVFEVTSSEGEEQL